MSQPPAATVDSSAYAAFYIAIGNARLLATEGNLDAAQRMLTEFADARVATTFGHEDTATFALELGLLRLAERELQLALRDSREGPQKMRALEALGEFHRTTGDVAKELRFREKIAAADPGCDRSRLEALRAELDRVGTVTLAAETRAETHMGTGAGTADARDVPRPRQAAEHAPIPAPLARSETPTRSKTPTPVGESGPTLKAPSHGDVARFQRLFEGRGDTHAKQWIGREGRHGYSPVERPLSRERVLAHLDGDETLGVYQVREDRTVLFFAIDLDATKNALQRARSSKDEGISLRRRLHREGLRIRAVAASVGLSLLLEDSGYKGRHLWGFLRNPMPIGLVRNFVRMLGRVVAPEDPDLTIECFPKQDRLKEGQLGNLIKLPLGIHLRSGRRAWLLDDDGRPADDPWALLRNIDTIDRESLLDVMENLRTKAADSGNAPDEDPGADGLDGARSAGPRSIATPPPPRFHLGDFSTDPELSTLLAGCPVLKKTVERGLERRRLAHSEQMVLRHVLGHRPRGVDAVNYVFKRCPEIPVENYLKTILSGNPMSCPKIRKHVPDITTTVACNCEFRSRPDQYSTPLSHLHEARAKGTYPRPVTLNVSASEPERVAAVAPEAVTTWAVKLSNAQEAVARAGRELLESERALAEALRLLPDGTLTTPEGRWRLVGEGAAARPVWEPNA